MWLTERMLILVHSTIYFFLHKYGLLIKIIAEGNRRVLLLLRQYGFRKQRICCISSKRRYTVSVTRVKAILSTSPNLLNLNQDYPKKSVFLVNSLKLWQLLSETLELPTLFIGGLRFLKNHKRGDQDTAGKMKGGFSI